jgi:hypothetical protein
MGEVIIDYTKRNKPWFHYTGEEKSHLIYNGYHIIYFTKTIIIVIIILFMQNYQKINSYLKRVLLSDDVKEFLRDVRIHNWTNFAFPLLCYPVLKLWSPR